MQKRIDELDNLALANGRIYKSNFIVRGENIQRYKGVFCGGNDECERVVYFSIPDFITNFKESDYIYCLKITPSDKADYGHRDYLGAIMSLQINRDMIGDILLGNKFAYVFGFKQVIEFLHDNLVEISRTSCKNEVVSLDDVEIVVSDLVEEIISVSSLRLDGVIARSFNLPREKVKVLIEKSLCKVNKILVTKTEKQINAGDVISLKGHGRIIIDSVVGESKKGKIRLQIKK